MKCNACGQGYSDDFDFCPFCGAYPKKFCPKCFKELVDGEKVCSSCGSELLPFEVFKKFHNLREKALDYRDKDNYEKSTEYFEKILDIWPNVEEINFLLAEDYEFLDEDDKALRQYDDKANIVAIDYDPGASTVNQLNRIKLMMSTAFKNLEDE